MRERRWGRIVCMASIAGLMGGFGQTAYSTSKIGVIGFAKSVALEGARYNVDVQRRRARHHRAQREPEPAVRAHGQARGDAAGGTAGGRGVAIAFLCSERARYITGAVLPVTGGMDLFTF